MSRVFLKSCARRVARLYVIDACDLNDQAIDCSHLEAHEVHHGIRCAPGVAKEIEPIHGGQYLAFRESQGQFKLLIEDEGKAPMPLLDSKPAKEKWLIYLY